MRVRLTIEYDGTGYCGWQLQASEDSVQARVEAVLEILFNQKIRIHAAGRTDAGVHALGAGDLPAARVHLEQAARAARAIGEESSAVAVNLGWVRRQDGDPDGARLMFEAGLRIARRNGDRPDMACACLGLACLAADRGDWYRAGMLHGVAQAFLDPTGEAWQDPEARYRRESLGRLHSRLGDQHADRAHAEGRALSLDKALDLALSWRLPGGQ